MLQEEAGLPPGWERVESADYGAYFVNHVTRQAQYEHPSRMRAAAEDNSALNHHMAEAQPRYEHHVVRMRAAAEDGGSDGYAPVTTTQYEHHPEESHLLNRHQFQEQQQLLQQQPPQDRFEARLID